MQAMTHFAVGLLGYSIYRAVNRYMQAPNPKNITAVISDGPSVVSKLFSFCLLLLILSLLVLSHVALDALAVATYHPPNPLWNSVFWLCFHAFVFGMALFLLWKHRAALLFLLASVVPDVDWLARPLGLWTEGAAHDFFRSLPGVRLINDKLRAFLPDWRFVEMAALNELVLFAGVMLFASFFASIRAEQKLS